MSNEKADAGREAMLRMVAGFEALARGMVEVRDTNLALAQVNQQLAVTNQQLQAQIQLAVQHEAALMEHLASLQRQVAALTAVVARQAGVAVGAELPARRDPIGAFGQRVVDGLLGGFVPDDEPPRGRRRH